MRGRSTQTPADPEERPIDVDPHAMGDLIEAVFRRHRRRYGYRRLGQELSARGVTCAPARIRRIMAQRALRAIQPKVEAQSDPSDAEAVRKFSASIKIEQHKDRAVLTASVPFELLKKIAAPDAAEVSAPDAGAGAAISRSNPTGP